MQPLSYYIPFLYINFTGSAPTMQDKAKLTLWCNGDNISLVALLISAVDSSDCEIVLHPRFQTITCVVSSRGDTGVVRTRPILRTNAVLLYSVLHREGRVEGHDESDGVVGGAATALNLESVGGLWGRS